MDTAVIRAINRLWLPVYPGLARQAAEQCLQQPSRMLEVGCFSGGTGLELLKMFPHSSLDIALEIPGLAETFYDDWPAVLSGRDAGRITIVSTPLFPLPVPIMPMIL